ncbi:MAG: hypothetical protein K2G49_11170 [Muribaculum sp.]|nr:hypothetical protein [Muribaculum sp.]
MIHNTQCRGEWKLARAASTQKQRRDAARLHPPGGDKLRVDDVARHAIYGGRPPGRPYSYAM